MKRIFSILLVTALLAGLLPLISTVAVAESYATVTSTNGYGVRLREGPSKAYGVIGKYNVGTTVVVLQRGSEWSQLQIGTTTGWMMNRYLVYGVTGTPSTGSNGASGTNATVISDNGLRVWLRATAGGKRLFLNAVGTAVTVLERGNTWCKVSIGGTVGYMMTKYLSIGNPTPAPASTVITGVEINYPSPVVMDTLVATPIPADATVSYAWTVDGVVLGTEREFYVKTNYANQKIAVTITGTGVYTGSAVGVCDAVQISKSIKSVALSNATPLVGDTLSAAIKPSSATVEYSWRVGGVEVSNEATYTVTQDDLGKLVQLKVTGIGGFVGSAACSASANVASDKAIQSVKISNVCPVVGEVLSTEIKPSGATVNILWLANDEVVATTASYKVGDMDLGKKITVKVTGVEPYTGSALATTNSVASAALTGVKLSNASPVVGDTVYASITPANASAIYSWWTIENGAENVIPGATGSSLTLTDAMQLDGKPLKVYATGTGIYTGTVAAATNPVISNKQITAVSLSNASPVIGDTIVAVVTPAQADASQLSYIWTVDTETAPVHGQVYTVAESDWNKRIRVHVIGVDPYRGEAFSAYSNPVLAGMDIAGVSIFNVSANNNASSVSPEVGHVLRADVNPGTATVAYQWRADGVDIPGATERTYTTQPSDWNKQISVYVKGIGRYGKEAAATTARVIQLTPVNVNLIVTAPQAGVKPSYGVSGTDKQCTASVVWMEGHGAIPAELTASGTYKPGTVYGALIGIIPQPGYTMMGASIQINGQPVAPNGNYAYRDFDATAEMTVTDYILSGIEQPTVSAGGSVTQTVSNSQVTGTIEWTYNPKELVNAYSATITLTPKPGYTLTGVPANAFKVIGADGTANAAGSNTVTAVWLISHELSIRTDKDQVLLDGYHNSIVQCTAYLTNYEGDLEDYIQWDILSSDADATVMRDDGTLTVGMNETPGRSLTIRATVTIPGADAPLVATKELPIVSGTDTDTQIKISFVKAPTQLRRIDGYVDGYYEAIVSNSTKGCKLFTIIGDEWFPFSGSRMNVQIPDRKIKSVVVRAVANEDHSVVCNTLVEISDIELSFVKAPIQLKRGESGYFDVAVSNSTKGYKLFVVQKGYMTPLGDNGLLDTNSIDADINFVVVRAIANEDSSVVCNTVVEIVDATEAETQAIENAIMTLDLAAPEDAANNALAPAETTEPEVQPTEAPAEPTEPEAQPTEAPAETTEPEAQPTEAPAEPTEPEVQPTEAPAETTEPEVQPTEAPAETTEPEAQPTEAPAETTEPEILDDVTITISGEATVPTPVEEEEPAQNGIVIKDMQTGETVDIISDTPAEETSNQPEEKPEESSEQQPAETEKQEPSKKAAAEEESSEEDELDSLEGDDLLGESVESASGIKIVFTKKTGELKRGGSATFAVDVTGSENGVTWSVRRSKDSEGNAVSTITQDGKLTISKAETSDKLIVVATSVDDGTVRARLIVQVTNAATNSAPSKDTSGDEPSDGTQIAPAEEEKPTAEEPAAEEIQPEAERFTPEQLEQINKEIEQNALDNSAANDL